MITYPLPEERQTFTVIREDEPYTYSDYFKLGLTARDAVRFHHYRFEQRRLNLPIAIFDQEIVAQLQNRLTKMRPRIIFNNEVARREFLISPIIAEIALAVDIEVRTEFVLNIENNLRGTLDYLLRGNSNVVVVEAKKADLELGFTQLATEMIALDKWDETSQKHILGAVSIGDVWQFGLLDRQQKLVAQDLQLYTVPDDLEQVLGILVAELKGEA